jgi:hypothetical protein
MSREIARSLLEQKVSELQALSYPQLLPMLDQSTTVFETGSDGKWYQIEAQVFWDDRKDSNLRVLVTVDGGGVSAVKPLCSDFIATPEKSERSTSSDF